MEQSKPASGSFAAMLDNYDVSIFGAKDTVHQSRISAATHEHYAANKAFELSEKRPAYRKFLQSDPE